MSIMRCNATRVLSYNLQSSAFSDRNVCIQEEDGLSNFSSSYCLPNNGWYQLLTPLAFGGHAHLMR